MKNYTKNIFFTGLILAFGFLNIAAAQDKDPSADVYTAFTLLETYIETGDYDAAWKVMAKPYQEEMFKGDIENFKKYYSGKKNQPYEIESVKFLSPEKAKLTILRDNQQEAAVMVRENGEWKFTEEAEKSEILLSAKIASSPAAQAYLAHETAIINQDYEKAWEMECAPLRENRWKNNFEAFKAFYLEEKIERNEKARFLLIEDIKDISSTEVHIEAATTQTFVMVNDNGKWCFAGVLDDIRSWR